jgi:hypothetical protein
MGCIGGWCARHWPRPSRRRQGAGAGRAAADPAKGLIDAMLTEDVDAPRKQRHTARRVLARLVDEHGLARPKLILSR